ncbi:uncharacterized protein TRAVEDRAFT_69076 [Trametes versicolor FP-101664 SS1]|uniref:uncharacterized protein n=1 Tax=Trametes versicolor (strain FP-101664) TaxID=717944 RepID=UPI0004622F57|nr:uncharacterized protein TRAVEDRAFT_69076 [Trametes versicolor FP-101664 SS1]EIW62844.1 hypothetical protein TRAVEDRAFT_69076 [Trametes versicolor FP-101664 SS1]
MNSLPLETLQRIFELACTDGGRTGNSLSLTSKGVRSAARTARFRSVILNVNHRPLQSFMALYERECDPALGDKLRIQHLYLTFPSIGGTGTRPRNASRRSLSPSSRREHSLSYESAHSSSPARSQSRPRSRHRTISRTASSEDIAPPSDGLETEDGDIYVCEWPSRGRQRTPDTIASPGYLAAVRTLFRLSAPDLQTLAIKSGDSFGGQLELPCIEQPLPNLRELALVDVREPRALFAEGTSGAPLFPHLTHLHIVSDFTVSDLAFPMWAAHAPRLTHLRVTGVTSGHVPQLAQAVGIMLLEHHPPVIVDIPGSYNPPSPPPPPRPRTNPRVRELVMQPCPAPRGGLCGNPMIEHDEMVDDLQQIERECRGSGIRVAVLLPTNDADGREDVAEQAQEDWVERIHPGGDATGCWPGLLYVRDVLTYDDDDADLQLFL